MVKKVFLKSISEKEVLFLTQEVYETIFLPNIKIFCLGSYVDDIQEIVEKSDINIGYLVTKLQESIVDGLVILEFNKKIIILAPFLDLRLSWFENNSTIILSDSSVEIAKFLKLQISKQRLASQLVLGLPFYPFQTICLWEEISIIKPMAYLEISEKGCLEKFIALSITNNLTKEQQQNTIKHTFLDSISRALKKGQNSSSDVSGGVDSAVITFSLNNMISEFELLHAESARTSNSDTKWAKHIANFLGKELRKFDSIEQSEKRFSVSDTYIDGIVPSSPLLWADSEGYLKSVASFVSQYQLPIHFLGIGGDELFTPMPSSSWSIVRQEGVGGIFYAFKYSLFMRRPFLKCIADLINNQQYTEAISDEIEHAFQPFSKKIKRELGWIDNIEVAPWVNKEMKSEIKIFLKSLLSINPQPISTERTQFQILQSLLFQKAVLRQIQLTDNHIYWATPFLDKLLIERCLSIAEKHKINSKYTKPMLRKALKGIVPDEIFSRGFKGDYSDALYSGYNKAINDYYDKLDDFLLVKMGIVNVEKLRLELSLPTGNPSRIDFFERLCSVERWLRQVESYINDN